MRIIQALTALSVCLQAVAVSQAPFGVDKQGLKPTRLLSKGTRAYIAELQERWGLGGVSIAVVASPAYKHGVEGTASGKWHKETFSAGAADASGKNVNDNSLFCIASNSKLFTAMAVGLLIEDETRLPNGDKLSLTTKVKDVLPEWKLSDAYASEHATVSDLLSMRSGMPRHDLSHGDVPPADLIRNLRNLPTRAELRQYWQYQNAHYVALSHMVPTLTGEAFVDFVKRRILDPLGMGATTYNHTLARETGRRTEGFSHTNTNFTRCAERWKGARDLDASCRGTTESFGWFIGSDGVNDAGPGGVVTSAEDMTTWLAELLAPRVLPRSFLASAATPIMIAAPSRHPELSDRGYGFGQDAYTYRGFRAVAHGGDVPGQMSMVVRFPSEGFGVVVMVNDEYMGGRLLDVLVYAVVDNLLGLERVDWESRTWEAFIGDVRGAAPTARPRKPAEPEGGFDGVPGLYGHAGYGPPRRLVPADEIAATHKAVAAHIPTDVPTFVLVFDHLFVTAIVYSHFDGQLYNATGVWVSPTHPERGLVLQTATAVIVPSGIGMFGGFAGYGASVPLPPLAVEGVEEAAEVFFRRQD